MKDMRQTSFLLAFKYKGVSMCVVAASNRIDDADIIQSLAMNKDAEMIRMERDFEEIKATAQDGALGVEMMWNQRIQ